MPSDMGRILAAPWCAAAVRKSGSSLPSATATYTAMRKAAAAGVQPSQQVPRGDDAPGSPLWRGPRSLVRRRSASAGRLVRHKAATEQQCKAPLEVDCPGSLVTAWQQGQEWGMLHVLCCTWWGASWGCCVLHRASVEQQASVHVQATLSSSLLQYWATGSAVG